MGGVGGGIIRGGMGCVWNKGAKVGVMGMDVDRISQQLYKVIKCEY
jgi:hypothetical protein